MRRFLKWVIDHPWSTILGLLVVTLLFGYQMRRLRVETDITKSLPQSIPAKRLYDRMAEIFPSKDFIMVIYESDSLFSVPSLRVLDELTQQLEAFPELYSVISPTNVKIIRSSDQGMEVKEALLAPPSTDRDVQLFQTRLYSNPIFVRNLVSRDRRAAGILLFLHNDIDAKKFAGRLLQFLESFKREYPVNLFAAGTPVVNYYLSEGVARDMRIFFNAGIALIILLLLLIFRSLRGVLIPTVVVLSSVLWTLGFMASVGVPLSHSTEMLPILLIAIGIADSIHILTHYYQRAPDNTDRRDLVYTTMAELAAPLVMTSLTTMAGFLALNTSHMESLMQLGIFSAFGVLVALIWSLTFVPAVLCLLKIRTRRGGLRGEFPLSRWMHRYGTALMEHRRVVLAGIGGVVLISFLGFPRLYVESSAAGQFPRNHPVRQAIEYVDRHFAGTQTFQIVVEGNAPGAIKTPVVLAKMDSLERFAESLPHVGSTLSLADFVRLMNRVMHGGDPAYDRIPAPVEKETGVFYEKRNGREVPVTRTFEVSGEHLIAQYLQLYEMSTRPEEFAQFVDYDYENAKITVFIDSDRGSVLRRVDRDLHDYIQKHFGDLRADVTGMAKLVLVVRDMVVRGQFWSILTSLVLVWFLATLMFRSPLLGVYNTLPLFFGMFLNFAVMGWFRIPLDIETMVTSSLAIGVGVDYAIHFIHRYRMRVRSGDDFEAAVPATMASAGVAILFNSLTVAAGFGLIILSSFKGVRSMGLLLALTMLTTAFGALTILPVLFATFRPRVLARTGRRGRHQDTPAFPQGTPHFAD